MAEAETMSKLVQQHGHEIGLRAVIVVDTEIEIEVGAEVGVDVVACPIEIDAGELIRQRDVIPRVRERRAGEVARDADRTGAAVISSFREPPFMSRR